MQGSRLELIPYPAIEKHGLIGDRRTAALVASDGTIDWLCLPAFDGRPYLGALVDAKRGGFFRLGPAIPMSGEQRYVGETAVLQTILVRAPPRARAHRRARVARARPRRGP